MSDDVQFVAKSDLHNVVRRKRHAILSTDVLEICIDDLIDSYATDEERAMHAERMETKYAALRERYWPTLQGAEPEPDPTRRNSGMPEAVDFNAYHERAMTRQDALTPRAVGAVNHASYSLRAMAAEDWYSLARYAEAMGDRDRALNGGPLPCQGCGGAESTCNCECGYRYCGCPCHLAAERAAIEGARR